MRAPLKQPDEPAPATEAPAVIHLSDARQPKKKVTRGSENRQRSVPVLVRLHPADAERLRAEAAAAKMSLPGYLAAGRLDRETALRPRLHRRRTTADVAALLKALVDFSRANTLLNQTTRTANTLALFAEEHGAGRLTQEVRALRQAVEALHDQFAAPITAIHAALGDDSEG